MKARMQLCELKLSKLKKKKINQTTKPNPQFFKQKGILKIFSDILKAFLWFGFFSTVVSCRWKVTKNMRTTFFLEIAVYFKK